MPFFVRRLKKDHRGDLPPVMPDIEISTPMTPAQWKIYNQFADLSLAWIDDSPVPAAHTLVQDLRLKQLALGVPTVIDGEVTFADNCKSTKLDALIELLKDNPDSTFFVLSPSLPFVHVVVSRLNKLGIKAEAFVGDTKQKRRDELVETLGDDYRVLVATIPTVAEGLDGLQYRCSRGVWLGKHSNAMLNTQGGERLDRPGQTEPVQWWNMVAPDTKDEDTEERLYEIGDTLAELYDRY
jgi:SNF2 family DNA or RNA helicase